MNTYIKYVAYSLLYSVLLVSPALIGVAIWSPGKEPDAICISLFLYFVVIAIISKAPRQRYLRGKAVGILKRRETKDLLYWLEHANVYPSPWGNDVNLCYLAGFEDWDVLPRPHFPYAIKMADLAWITSSLCDYLNDDQIYNMAKQIVTIYPSKTQQQKFVSLIAEEGKGVPETLLDIKTLKVHDHVNQTSGGFEDKRSDKLLSDLKTIKDQDIVAIDKDQAREHRILRKAFHPPMGAPSNF